MIRFNVFSTDVKIDFSFFMFTALIFMVNDCQKTVLFFSACMIHELGHLIAMCILGAKSRSIYISGLGINIRQANDIMIDSVKSLIILICGPMVNLSVFIMGGDFFSDDFLKINLALFIFNIMPFRNLDGGSILVHIGRILEVEIVFDYVLKVLSVIIALLVTGVVCFIEKDFLIVAVIILYYCFSEIFL